MRRASLAFHRTALALAGAALFSGCAVGPTKEDPLEPWNRQMYAVHQVVDGNVIKPLAEALSALEKELAAGASSVDGCGGRVHRSSAGKNDLRRTGI